MFGINASFTFLSSIAWEAYKYCRKSDLKPGTISSEGFKVRIGDPNVVVCRWGELKALFKT